MHTSQHIISLYHVWHQNYYNTTMLIVREYTCAWNGLSRPCTTHACNKADTKYAIKASGETLQRTAYVCGADLK